MSRTPIAIFSALASLTVLAACDRKPSEGANVTLRDMEVVDGTANDSMADLDNATEQGTALENAAAAGNASAVTNQSAAMPKPTANASEPASADKGIKKTTPSAAE